MKDAKGHGSNKRGEAGAVPAKPYEGKPTWHGVTPEGGKVTNSAGNPIAYASREAAVSGAAHVASIAAAHGLPTGQLSRRGGPFKVQSLNTKLAGNSWGTAKRYGNKTVAERVAQHMRTDGGYTRVR